VLNVKIDDLRVQFASFDVDPCDRNRKVKSAGPGTPRVEKQYAAPPLYQRLVRVPEDDRRDSGGAGVDIEIMDIVEHVNGVTTEFHEFRGRQVAARTSFIHVPTDRGDGGDGP
jgi:hypothetical protein